MTTTVPDADAVFEHLNGNHADSVLFLARHVAGDPALTDAELLVATSDGVEIEVRGHEGDRRVQLTAPTPLASTADLQGLLIGTMSAARAAAPEGELTSIERELATQGSIPTRVVEVVAIEDLASDLRQITFGGMRGHVALGPDDFFLVIRPKDLSELDGDVSFADFKDRAPEDQPGWAYYTCRAFRPEVGELDAWFVLHEHDGPISGWARSAEVGDRVALWGPRESFEPPQCTASILLVGDETGLGAFAAILDAYGSGAPVTVVVESDDGQPVIDLPAREKDTVHWVARAGERGTGTALVDTVTTLELETEGLYAYGAAESREITAVRKHLRGERGIPGPQVQMIGYWRR